MSMVSICQLKYMYSLFMCKVTQILWLVTLYTHLSQLTYTCRYNKSITGFNFLWTKCINFSIYNKSYHLGMFRCCLCTPWHTGTGRHLACWRRPGWRRCMCACRLRTRPYPGHTGHRASQLEDCTHNLSLGHTWRHPRHSCTCWHSWVPSGLRRMLRGNSYCICLTAMMLCLDMLEIISVIIIIL